MSANKRYLLDSNVFMQAHRQYYGFDICPGFWRSLVLQHSNKRIFSVDHVKSEIARGKDALKNWATTKAPDAFFKKTDDKAVINCFAQLIDWVEKEPQYAPEAKAEFASVADGWVIAHAKTNNLVVVTQEEYAPDAKKKVPMPNVCINFSVEFVNTFSMLRDLGVRFGLKKRN